MLKHLNVDEMVALSGPWIDDPKRRAHFLGIPEIAALHPKVAQIHRELLSARPADGEVAPELQKIIDAADAVGNIHDPLARVTAAGIDLDRHLALAATPPDLARAKQAEEVYAKLFPGGMNIINASLLAESGNTARVARLLGNEPAIGAFLQAIPVRGKGTLLDTVHRWLDAGEKLEKLERAREEFESIEITQPTGKVGINVHRARWIRIVSLILTNLEIADAPTETVEVIRGPVLKAADRAGKRYESGGEAMSVEPAAATVKSAAVR